MDGIQLFGPTKIAESLRKIAARFDERIQENAEKVIAAHQAEMDAIIAKYRPRLEGKRIMLFVGGLRPRHAIGAYEDLGMEVTYPDVSKFKALMDPAYKRMEASVGAENAKEFLEMVEAEK